MRSYHPPNIPSPKWLAYPNAKGPCITRGNSISNNAPEESGCGSRPRDRNRWKFRARRGVAPTMTSVTSLIDTPSDSIPRSFNSLNTSPRYAAFFK